MLQATLARSRSLVLEREDRLALMAEGGSVADRISHWNSTVATSEPAEEAAAPTTSKKSARVTRASTARLHALVQTNARKTSPRDPLAPLTPNQQPRRTPPTEKARRVAEDGLKAAEALEGQMSDRKVAALKAAALEEAAESYRQTPRRSATGESTPLSKLSDSNPDISAELVLLLSGRGKYRPTTARSGRQPTPRSTGRSKADLAITARLLDYWEMVRRPQSHAATPPHRHTATPPHTALCTRVAVPSRPQHHTSTSARHPERVRVRAVRARACCALGAAAYGGAAGARNLEGHQAAQCHMARVLRPDRITRQYHRGPPSSR
jgi:hypothetical protein